MIAKKESSTNKKGNRNVTIVRKGLTEVTTLVTVALKENIMKKRDKVQKGAAWLAKGGP